MPSSGGRQVRGASRAEPEGGQVGRAIQAVGIALMTAGLLLDSARRKRDRRAGPPGGNPSSRLPLSLFWIGAVLLVLASI
jgi:hypothetical protein